MAYQKCIFVLLLACASLISASDVDKEDELYIIRSAPSGLVLDADDPVQIKIQRYTGSKSQLFTFVRGRSAGLFHIVNNQTGSVLDFAKTEERYTKVVLSDKSNALDQQWYLNSNGRIVNADNHKAMDVKDANYQPGNPVGIWPYNGTPGQQFILQKQSKNYGKSSGEEIRYMEFSSNE